MLLDVKQRFDILTARECEAVVSHEGLPRCLNSSHRSPSGNCEVRSSPSGDDLTSGPTNFDQNDNSDYKGISIM
jgi:hypothetical protein